MRFIFGVIMFFALANLLIGCGNKNNPDVSKVKVDLKTYRFEQELFVIDTNNISNLLPALQSKYKEVYKNYFYEILGAEPRWSNDTLAIYLKGFLGGYRGVYDTCVVSFKSFEKYEQEIKKGLQHVKYYFPKYNLPTKIITYIGPLDGYGDALAEDAIMIGLHQHLGANYSLYKSMLVSEIYPEYISRNFTQENISTNAMKNIVLDLYPESDEQKTLITQMIEKGKRLYLLQNFLPDAKEHQLLGYTEKQIKECYDHEAAIWGFFVENNLLQNNNYEQIKNYVNEGPKTIELGEASPGNIGSFVGLQIVKKYSAKNNDISLDSLLNIDNEKIFAEAKYKP